MSPQIPPTIPQVPVLLDRPRVLVEDFTALAAFEAKTGVDPMDLDAMENLTPAGEIVRLWAQLLRDDPDITIDEANDLISSPAYLPLIKAAQLELVRMSIEMMADAMKGREVDDSPPRRGTGGNKKRGRKSTSV